MGSHPAATRESPSNELERRKQALDQCQNLITHFKNQASQNKRLFQWLRNLSVVLTVTVSSIAAVEGVPRWIVAVVSGIAALCTALPAAIRPQEIWLQARSTQQQLQVELFLYQQCAGDYGVSNDEDGRDFLPSGLPTCGLRVINAGNAAGLRSSNNWNCQAPHDNDKMIMNAHDPRHACDGGHSARAATSMAASTEV
jgi:hypothetical protein